MSQYQPTPITVHDTLAKQEIPHAFNCVCACPLHRIDDIKFALRHFLPINCPMRVNQQLLRWL